MSYIFQMSFDLSLHLPKHHQRHSNKISDGEDDVTITLEIPTKQPIIIPDDSDSDDSDIAIISSFSNNQNTLTSHHLSPITSHSSNQNPSSFIKTPASIINLSDDDKTDDKPIVSLESDEDLLVNSLFGNVVAMSNSMVKGNDPFLSDASEPKNEVSHKEVPLFNVPLNFSDFSNKKTGHLAEGLVHKQLFITPSDITSSSFSQPHTPTLNIFITNNYSKSTSPLLQTHPSFTVPHVISHSVAKTSSQNVSSAPSNTNDRSKEELKPKTDELPFSPQLLPHRSHDSFVNFQHRDNAPESNDSKYLRNDYNLVTDYSFVDNSSNFVCNDNFLPTIINKKNYIGDVLNNNDDDNDDKPPFNNHNKSVLDQLITPNSPTEVKSDTETHESDNTQWSVVSNKRNKVVLKRFHSGTHTKTPLPQLPCKKARKDLHNDTKQSCNSNKKHSMYNLQQPQHTRQQATVQMSNQQVKPQNGGRKGKTANKNKISVLSSSSSLMLPAPQTNGITSQIDRQLTSPSTTSTQNKKSIASNKTLSVENLMKDTWRKKSDSKHINTDPSTFLKYSPFSTTDACSIPQNNTNPHTSTPLQHNTSDQNTITALHNNHQSTILPVSSTAFQSILPTKVTTAMCFGCKKSYSSNNLSHCMTGHGSCGGCIQRQVKTLLARGKKVGIFLNQFLSKTSCLRI